MNKIYQVILTASNLASNYLNKKHTEKSVVPCVNWNLSYNILSCCIKVFLNLNCDI